MFTLKGTHIDGTPPKTNMTMEHPPFEDVCSIEHGDVPMLS